MRSGVAHCCCTPADLKLQSPQPAWQCRGSFCAHTATPSPHPLAALLRTILPSTLQLPDGTEIQVGADRFKVPELLFQPVSAALGQQWHPREALGGKRCVLSEDQRAGQKHRAQHTWGWSAAGCSHCSCSQQVVAVLAHVASSCLWRMRVCGMCVADAQRTAHWQKHTAQHACWCACRVHSCRWCVAFHVSATWPTTHTQPSSRRHARSTSSRLTMA